MYNLRHTLLDNDEDIRHDEVSTYSCPTEEGWTTDLKSGHTERIYCMLGGRHLIHDDCNIIQNETLPMVGLGINKIELPRSTLSIQFGNNDKKISQKPCLLQAY